MLEPTNGTPRSRAGGIQPIMKRGFNSLSRRYGAALQAYLNQGSGAPLQPARGLGRQTIALGLGTLDLAKIHRSALAALTSFGKRPRTIHRAELFFTEAATPIEKTHRGALEATNRLNQLRRRLGRRTKELATANHSLQQGISERKQVERSLRKSGDLSAKLLAESHRLEKHLRHLTHQLLLAQEDKRKKISHELQDEIVQTLLGINVRLLTLKKEAAISAQSFRNEIARTGRLVDKSTKRIQRVARIFGRRHES